jgi:hypothetical protein
MIRKISNSASSPREMNPFSLNFGRPTKRSAQHLTRSLAHASSRFAWSPLGSLWDPTLLDRLQAPLTRHRE